VVAQAGRVLARRTTARVWARNLAGVGCWRLCRYAAGSRPPPPASWRRDRCDQRGQGLAGRVPPDRRAIPGLTEHLVVGAALVDEHHLVGAEQVHPLEQGDREIAQDPGQLLHATVGEGPQKRGGRRRLDLVEHQVVAGTTAAGRCRRSSRQRPPSRPAAISPSRPVGARTMAPTDDHQMRDQLR
jgi:hypothetical protein